MFQRKTQKEIMKYFYLNENENATLQNVWKVAKAVLRGKFIILILYIRKQESFKSATTSEGSKGKQFKSIAK